MIHCTKCFEVQPDNGYYFPINKRAKSGFSPWCKGCTQDYKKEYRKKNIDILKEKREKNFTKAKEKKQKKRVGFTD